MINDHMRKHRNTSNIIPYLFNINDGCRQEIEVLVNLLVAGEKIDIF
jgi:hypothetical protein